VREHVRKETATQVAEEGAGQWRMATDGPERAHERAHCFSRFCEQQPLEVRPCVLCQFPERRVPSRHCRDVLIIDGLEVREAVVRTLRTLLAGQIHTHAGGSKRTGSYTQQEQRGEEGKHEHWLATGELRVAVAPLLFPDPE